jgi:hypothetical protein
MATITKTKQNFLGLRQEVGLIWSFVIGIAGKDKEGKYRPEFVRKILRAVSEKPTRQFSDPKSFLAQIIK